MLLSVFLISSAVINSISSSTITKAYLKDDKPTGPNIFNNSLVNTSMVILINNSQIYPGEVYSVDIGEYLNVTVFFRDNNSNPLSKAIINLTRGGITYNLTEDVTKNQYIIILTTSNPGLEALVVTAWLTGYESQFFSFNLETVEISTSIHIFLNKVNVTNDPTIELPIGDLLNVTVKYLDINNQHIQGATIELTYDIFTDFLIENSSFSQYSYILNTTQLPIGVNYILVIASKTNYQTQVEDFIINVRRIRINISGNSLIEVFAGETIHIEVEVADGDFGGPIIGANVWYLWEYGQGVLTDLNSDGIYEVNLTTIALGNYKLEIIAEKGVIYVPEEYQITIIITNPIELFILASSADIPDLDGTFYLAWITSEYADNYSIYVYKSKITQINSSVILLDAQVYDSPYLISGSPDGIYYYVVVAFNEYGNVSSNCIQVIVSRSIDVRLISGYSLFTLISIISLSCVFLIKKQLRSKNRTLKIKLEKN